MSTGTLSSGVVAEQASEYWERGFMVARGRFTTAEAKGWKQECERLWAQPGLLDPLNLRVESRGHAERERVLDRLDPVLDLSPQLEALVRQPRILSILSELLGESASLLRCKLIRKTPGTGGYGLHQDYPYWEWLDLPPDDLITVAIAIDPADEAVGAIELFPGYHHDRLPASPNDPRDVDESSVDLTRGCRCQLDAGDLLFFHSLAPHRSGTNLGNHSRTVLLPTYVAARHGPLYDRYYDWFLRRKSDSLTDLSAAFLENRRSAV